MPRLSKEEQRVKIEAAWDEFEKIRITAADKGVNEFTWEQFVNRINKREDILQFKTGISPSTLKQPKTDELKILKKEIDEFCKNFSITKSMVPDLVKEQLNSSLAANYVLTEKIENLTQKLKAKDVQLKIADNRIIQLLDTINQLRQTSRETGQNQ
jgi:hypothetical protein